MSEIRSLSEIASHVRQRRLQLATLPQPQMQTELLDNVSNADIQVLERIFLAEIEGRLPAQFKSRLLESLVKRVLVAPMTLTLGGPLPVRVDGWQLTHYGRMTYCASCPDDDENAQEAKDGGINP